MLIYGNLKRKFKVPKYSLLRLEQYCEVKKHLYVERAKFRKHLRLLKPVKFKEYTIDVIIRVWCMIKINQDILDFASKKLNKKVTSLEKLSANDIDTLYNKVMYQKQKYDKMK